MICANDGSMPSASTLQAAAMGQKLTAASPLRLSASCQKQTHTLQQRTVDYLPSLASGGLWRGRMTCPEMLETAGDASKATAEVACGCELYFDRLS